MEAEPECRRCQFCPTKLPCRHCGGCWGVHRCGDELCPGVREDGSIWRGQWETSPGTHFAAVDEVTDAG